MQEAQVICMTVTCLSNCMQMREEKGHCKKKTKKKCRYHVYVICRHQHKISNNFLFFWLKKVIRGNQNWTALRLPG